MKSYPKYLYTDIISITTLVFVIIGLMALIFPDKDSHTVFWIGLVIVHTSANVGYYLWQRHNYYDNK